MAKQNQAGFYLWVMILPKLFDFGMGLLKYKKILYQTVIRKKSIMLILQQKQVSFKLKTVIALMDLAKNLYCQA